ncbi:MAG: hypothetical protein Q9224_006492, partial [Gallowayella concinna]
MLDYIGVKHVREDPPFEWTLPILQRLADDGIRFNLGMRGPNLDLLSSIKAIEALEASRPGSVAFVEGPNELNQFDYIYKEQEVRSDQLGVARVIHEDMQGLVEQSDVLSD